MSKVGQSPDRPEKVYSRVIIPARQVVIGGSEETPYALAWALQRCGLMPKVRILKSIADAGKGRLSPGEVWLWVGEAPDLSVDEMAVLGQLLDEQTRARLTRLARKQDRASVGIAHGSLRLLLGAILDVAPTALRFQRGTHGKPYLVSPCDSLDRSDRLHFNLSHTEGAVAIALARQPVGVDIEVQRDLPDLLGVAQTVFAPETVAAVANAPTAKQRRSLFYRHWTLGEALIKASGGGMSHDLKSFAFSSRGAPGLSRAEGAFRHVDRWAFGIFGVGITSTHQD